MLALSGVDIMEDANTFKSTYKIMDELAKKWKDLSDIQQASITELIAGKRQGNVVSSLMQNFDIARNALETSLNSSGSAMQEHEKWMKSLEARINKLKATWQSLSQSFMSSNFLKGLLDGVISLVNGFDKLIDTFGTLPTLLTLFAAFKSFTGKGFFRPVVDEATGAAKGITNAFREAAAQTTATFKTISLKTDSSFKDGLKNDISALNHFKAEVKHGSSVTDALNSSMKNASVAAQEYAKSGKLATDGVSGFIKQQQSAEVALLAQNKSLGSASSIIKEYYTGCKNAGMGQKEFRDAVSQTNPKLAEQLANAKTQKGAMVGYAKSMIGAKAATIGLKVATMALNTALTMGIGLLVSWIFEGLDKLIETSSELAERVDEVTSKFKEQHNELKKLKGSYDTSNESSMISKYGKLSKGVDNLGRNVSLTADEYSEYQGIVNKIAEQIPSLVSGYDEQGNALLSVKGNVEELTAAYEKLIHAQNQEILTKSGDIEKNFGNALKKSSGDGLWSNGHGLWAGILEIFGLHGATNLELKNDTVENLQRLLSSSGNKDAILKKLSSDRYSKEEIRDALKSSGIKVEWWQDPITVLEKTLKTDPQKIKGIIDNYYSQFSEIVEQQKTIAQAKLSEAFDISSGISGLNYGNISKELQDVARQTINSLDFEFFSELQEEGQSVESWVDDMLNQLNSISDSDNAIIETAFDLQTQFNGGEVSYGEYVNGLKEAKSTITDLDLNHEAKNQLKSTLDVGQGGIISEYDALVSRLSGVKRELLPNFESPFGFEDIEKVTSIETDFNISEDEAKKLLDGLSSEELSVAIDVITEMSDNDVKETVDEVQNAIDRELSIRGLTLDLDIEVEKTKLEALTTALTESFSGSGLSSDSISAVEGMFGSLSSYDPSKLFERTANGIHLNNNELRKLNSESKKTNIAKINKEMDSLGDIYNQTREELYKLTYGTDEYNTKAAELSGIEERIKQLEKLGAQYEGLASSYQEWQIAESSGSQRDMYETMLEGWENVGDEISRGWIDDGTREFIELIKGEKATIIDGDGVKKEISIATASAKDLKKVWKDLDKNIEHTTHSISDFFTVDEDGNSTSQGVYNFLDAIGQMEEEKFNGKDVVKRDKNGNIIGFDFQMVGGDKVIAEALGVSEELVQIMKRASADAGFVVTFDGSFEQLDILKEKAQKASETLNKVLKDNGKEGYSFDFNATKVDDITKQLTEAKKILDTFKNADGTINTKLEGAEEALTVASTLQSMLDKLTRPAYMEIEVSQVEDDLREPLKNLQDYRTKIEQLNQAKLHGADTTELESSIRESKDKVVADLMEIQEKNPKLAGELKIEGLTKEEIEKKVAEGKIEIPATIDIQLEMDEKLGILVDKALLDAGIIDQEEFNKRVQVYLDAEVDNDDAKDKTENAVGEVVSGEKREQNIEIIAKTLGTEDVDDLSSKLEGLDDTTIQAIAEVLGQVDVDKLKIALGTMTDVQVRAIAEAIGKGDVEGLQVAIGSLDSNTVQAIVEAFGYNEVNELIGAIDNLDPKTVQAVAQALGLGDVNTLQITVNNMQGNTVDAKVNTAGQSEKINTLQGEIDGMKGKTVDIVVNTIKRVFETVASGGKKKAAQRTGADPDGKGTVNGTANLHGSAFSRGDWRTQKSETALTGELGREIVVTPQNRWYTVGDNGAEFVNIPRGSIVFNHRQTEELLKNGKATSDGGRARALVNGTAYLGGTAHRGYGEWIAPEVSSFKVGYDYGKKKDSDKSQEVFDWIEVAIERIEREIDNLDQKANNVYKSWGERNKALADQIAMVGSEIDLQGEAYEGYMSAANEIGLSSEWKKKIENGAIDIDAITDENLADKISDYQKWYEKALECKDAIEELKETESELYAQRVENIATQYDGILGVIEHEKNMIEEYISQNEANAHLISGEYYKALISNENETVSKLQEKKNKMLSELQSGMASGKIVKDTEGWFEIVNSIDEVTLSIAESQTAIKEYEQTIQQLSWETFDLLQDKISSVTEESDFLIELMSSDKLHDDNGKLTDEGSATMGLHGQNYNTYMYQSELVAKEAERLKKEMAVDGYDTELEERYREMIALQQEYILSAQDEKEAIRDLVSDGIEIELDALQELIDKKNEELESERDLYEYQKKVLEQTKEISSLEKQMAAYSGDTSEEAMAKVQELKVSLEEAKTDLEETEYDRYISDQQQLLDDLYLQYEETLNTRLDNLDALVSDMITQINTDATSISTTIAEKADSVGYTLSDSMKNIWDTNSANLNNVVTTYGDKFSNAQTTTNNSLKTINSNLQKMITQLNKLAKTDVKSASISSAAKSEQANTKKEEPKKEPSATTATKTIKVGGMVNASGAQIYDYAGDKSGERQLYRNDPKYKVLKENGNWIQVRWHKLSSGITGWFKKSDVKAYKTGVKNLLNNEVAWTQENGRKEFIVRPSDGAILTPLAKGDSVLNANASGNIWNMANNPADFIKDNLNLGGTNIPNNSNVNNNYTQYLDNVVFSFPNVKNYEEMLQSFSKDPKFEKLLLAMTVDRLVGKSSLAKGKVLK